MKLLKLILQGFKSFADKTTIEFADGMTVIVGPNGCGKSNISDAVRWVLGEQNVRNIRGQKAEDVIFSGSEVRSQKNAATVTLIFDNSNNELPLDTAEVSIARKVYRDGESEFFINKRSCRLKDIQELLANTGLGKGSMVIIGQNRVDSILSAKPEERRIIFEEVAGINKYKMRKVDGLRKLEKASINTERVLDLKAIIEEQMEPLSKEAEKSIKWENLQAEKRTYQVTASLLKLTSARRMMAKYENDCIRLQSQNEEYTGVLDSISEKQKQLSKETSTHQEVMNAMAHQLADEKAKSEQLRGDYRVKEENLKHNKQELARLLEAYEDEIEAGQELVEDYDSVTQELKQEEVILKELQVQVADKQAQKIQMSKELAQAQAAYATLLQTSQTVLVKKNQLLQDKKYKTIELEKLLQEENKLKEAIERNNVHLVKLDEQIEILKEQYRVKSSIFEEFKKQSDYKESQYKEAEEKRYQLLRDYDAACAEMRQMHTRRLDLKRQDEEYASFSYTTKKILQSEELWKERIIGPIGELVQVPEKYTVAAEVAMGNIVSHLVVDTAITAQKIVEWLKHKNAGRTTFYPLDSMHSHKIPELEKVIKENGICGVMADLLPHESSVEELLQSLLGRVLVADSLAVARKVAHKFKYRFRIVTLDGQVVNAGGSMTGGSLRKKETTYFGRKAEIVSLQKKEKELQVAVEVLSRKKKEQDSLCADLSEQVTQDREQMQTCFVDVATLRERMGRLHNELEHKKQEQINIKDTYTKLFYELEQVRIALVEVDKQLTGLTKVEVPEQDLKSIEKQKIINKIEEELTGLHILAAKSEGLIHERQKELQRLKEKSNFSQNTATQLTTIIKKKKHEIEQIATLLVTMNKQCESAEQAWKKIEKDRTTMEALSGDFLEKQTLLENEWKSVQTQLTSIQSKLMGIDARLEMFRNEENKELEQLMSMGLTERTAEPLRMKGTISEIQKKISLIDDKITVLGAVNPNGVTEYETQKEKLDFYNGQLEDLRKAQVGLQKVVKEIDDAMSTQFLEAFEKINVEFGRTMKVMFRGGKGHLELTDKENPLNSGVELYLQLPGKRTQALTLMSGGERALTVCALLLSFMAYNPAPFCFLDEIDAALDDANVERYGRLINDYKGRTQFIIISHRKKTMEFADTLQGVTMAEKGVSSLITVRVGDYIQEE